LLGELLSLPEVLPLFRLAPPHTNPISKAKTTTAAVLSEDLFMMTFWTH
jgi:hypothetical protein